MPQGPPPQPQPQPQTIVIQEKKKDDRKLDKVL